MAPVGVPALKTYHCPNGYCIQIYNTSAGPNTHGSVYTYNSPDAQCNCNRSGVLCGSCPQGCGVSVLTNRCVTCGNENGLLILALCVVVVMATIAIVIYPHPLMAGFYPCLFAIQPDCCDHLGDKEEGTQAPFHTMRWYVDGTVECFTQGHLPLALFSILALVLEAGLIPLVVMISMEKLKPLTDAFKEDWRWWGAMELARRFLLLLFTLPFPGNPIPPSYLLMAYLCAYAFIQPYKSAVVNLVESNQDGCVVSGFTRFTGLLTPFYYLPLLAGVVCIAVGVASLLRAWNLPHAVRQQSTRIVSSSVHHSAVEEVGDYWHSTDYRLIQDDSPVVKM
eukprot:Em0589g1a